MELKVIKTLWGYTEAATTADELRRIKDAGFDGIEWGVPSMEPQQWRDLCGEIGLDYCAQIFAFDAPTYVAELENAVKYGPIVISAHDGRDKMTFQEGCDYFREVLKAEQDLGVTVAHETHRHRLFFTPWSTAQYLEEFEALGVCADFSHWCVVTESMLNDMEDWVTRACERTVHVHARVGFEESPQVSDPRAPEFRHYLERHEQWWDRIFALRKQRFEPFTTIDPEFGPPGYMPAQPYTQMPIVNLWDVHLWMANRIRSRWAK